MRLENGQTLSSCEVRQSHDSQTACLTTDEKTGGAVEGKARNLKRNKVKKTETQSEHSSEAGGGYGGKMCTFS